ncbi:HD domain-containing protein [Pedobacter sp. Du54]|uniref:HD domain-containing protein n=1 Tax=Pedobacter anseongensis TaxID=3133439 RepID=UPI00309536EA
MTTPYHILYQAISGYVALLFERHGSPALVYHNLEHTRRVVLRAMEIAGAYQLGDADGFVLFAAAWFHDTGQLFTVPQEHEHKSVAIMEEFMADQGVNSEVTVLVAGCILATRIPHRPETLLQEIICDADTYNLGTDEFISTDDQLREELSLRGFATGEGWDQSTLGFLRNHRFFTSYCREHLHAGKLRNIDIITRRIKKS